MWAVLTADAIFVLRATVEYFNARDAAVFLASLDTKMFDTIHQDKLFTSLTNVGSPEPVIYVWANGTAICLCKMGL